MPGRTGSSPGSKVLPHGGTRLKAESESRPTVTVRPAGAPAGGPAAPPQVQSSPAAAGKLRREGPAAQLSVEDRHCRPTVRVRGARDGVTVELGSELTGRDPGVPYGGITGAPGPGGGTTFQCHGPIAGRRAAAAPGGAPRPGQPLRSVSAMPTRMI
eukprot:157750-Hanusia_phi.AAC.1